MWQKVRRYRLQQLLDIFRYASILMQGQTTSTRRLCMI